MARVCWFRGVHIRKWTPASCKLSLCNSTRTSLTSYRCHPGPGREHTVGLAGGLAVQSIDVGFFGHTFVLSLWSVFLNMLICNL